MPFQSETILDSFGIPGIPIKQTLSSSFDVFSGININTSNFINTEQGIFNSNEDGRIPLGLFYFEDENF